MPFWRRGEGLNIESEGVNIDTGYLNNSSFANPLKKIHKDKKNNNAPS
jgi:hypothetical protein